MNLKPYVDYLLQSGIAKDAGLELLKGDTNLNRDEKNLIYCYCYPRQLLDRELPRRVQNYRQSCNIPSSGLLTPHLGEAALIIEAFRTEQYGRFIKHLIYSFSDPTKVSPVAGSGKLDCCICGKIVYENDEWARLVGENREKDDKQYLAFGSTESDVVLCKDCLVQLITATQILENIDPDYLDWRKQMMKSTKRSWEDLKL